MPDTKDFLLSRFSEDAEAWKVDHDSAMVCRDLEAHVRVGLRAYRAIRDYDDAWSRKVQQGTVPFDAENAKGIDAAYRWWLQPCDSTFKAIALMEQYAEVEGADELRKAHRTVLRILRTPVEEIISAMEEIAA